MVGSAIAIDLAKGHNITFADTVINYLSDRNIALKNLPIVFPASVFNSIVTRYKKYSNN